MGARRKQPARTANRWRTRHETRGLTLLALALTGCSMAPTDL